MSRVGREPCFEVSVDRSVVSPGDVVAGNVRCLRSVEAGQLGVLLSFGDSGAHGRRQLAPSFIDLPEGAAEGTVFPFSIGLPSAAPVSHRSGTVENVWWVEILDSKKVLPNDTHFEFAVVPPDVRVRPTVAELEAMHGPHDEIRSRYASGLTVPLPGCIAGAGGVMFALGVMAAVAVLRNQFGAIELVAGIAALAMWLYSGGRLRRRRPGFDPSVEVSEDSYFLGESVEIAVGAENVTSLLAGLRCVEWSGDQTGRRPSFRIVHEEWHSLGHQGTASLPIPMSASPSFTAGAAAVTWELLVTSGTRESPDHERAHRSQIYVLKMSG